MAAVCALAPAAAVEPGPAIGGEDVLVESDSGVESQPSAESSSPAPPVELAEARDDAAPRSESDASEDAPAAADAGADAAFQRLQEALRLRATAAIEGAKQRNVERENRRLSDDYVAGVVRRAVAALSWSGEWRERERRGKKSAAGGRRRERKREQRGQQPQPDPGYSEVPGGGQYLMMLLGGNGRRNGSKDAPGARRADPPEPGADGAGRGPRAWPPEEPGEAPARRQPPNGQPHRPHSAEELSLEVLLPSAPGPAADAPWDAWGQPPQDEQAGWAPERARRSPLISPAKAERPSAAAGAKAERERLQDRRLQGRLEIRRQAAEMRAAAAAARERRGNESKVRAAGAERGPAARDERTPKTDSACAEDGFSLESLLPGSLDLDSPGNQSPFGCCDFDLGHLPGGNAGGSSPSRSPRAARAAPGSNDAAPKVSRASAAIFGRLQTTLADGGPAAPGSPAPAEELGQRPAPPPSTPPLSVPPLLSAIWGPPAAPADAAAGASPWDRPAAGGAVDGAAPQAGSSPWGPLAPWPLAPAPAPPAFESNAQASPEAEAAGLPAAADAAAAGQERPARGRRGKHRDRKLASAAEAEAPAAGGRRRGGGAGGAGAGVNGAGGRRQLGDPAPRAGAPGPRNACCDLPEFFRDNAAPPFLDFELEGNGAASKRQSRDVRDLFAASGWQ